MYIVRRWYGYRSPWAMYYDKAFEDQRDAYAYADKMCSDAKQMGNEYRVEIITPGARIVYKSEDEED